MQPDTFRELLVTAVTGVLLVSLQPIAEAHHRPNFYCSDSGDLCQSTRKVDGVRKLGILLAAKYFKVFHLCVTDPDGTRVCAPFHIKDHGDGTFGRDVNWRKHFPYGGRGAYRVKWVTEDGRIGAILGFHLR